MSTKYVDTFRRRPLSCLTPSEQAVENIMDIVKRRSQKPEKPCDVLPQQISNFLTEDPKTKINTGTIR